MPFNRPPRIQKPLPDKKVEVPALPAVPSKPETGNWLMAILPMAAMILSIVLIMGVMSGNESGKNYLIFLPIMVVSYIGTFLTTLFQKKNYDKKVESARQSFRVDLRQVENELIALSQKEKEIRLSNDPDISECLRRAQMQNPRLGERRPQDADFLFTRIGVGSLPAAYHLEIASQKNEQPEFEQEFKFVQQLDKKYRMLEEMPIQVRFPNAGSIGIAGLLSEARDMARTILCQAVTHHWISELNVAAICTESALSEWSWLRDLPHASPLLKVLFNNPRGKKADLPSLKLLSALETEIHKREQWVEARKLVSADDKVKLAAPLPRLLVVVDGLNPEFNHAALELIQAKGLELGIHGIFICESSSKVPGNCGAQIRVSGSKITYEETGPEGFTREALGDFTGIKPAEALAKALSEVEWEDDLDTSRPPETITFLEMFNAERVEDLPVENWWGGSPPHGFLRAPIGRISATSDMIFDLNDRDGAHGPHGLLGGMTGSGKSEVLKAIILGLAVTHHPYEINFALIDFKGGAAFNELAKLPHTVGVVTDIESNATYAERVIQALSGEIEYRKRVLEDSRATFNFGRSHIDEYRKLKVKRPLPRLVIVFDEFAEFKQRNPEESKRLISIARQGRSLGVHLILATQNIEAAVDPEILQNSSFRICLKVSQPQDSIQMIGIPDAINLARGRAYFNANTRVLYQSAYSGATYQPLLQKTSSFNKVTRIYPDGKREELHISGQPARSKDENPLPSTEAAAVVQHLNELALRLNIKHPPAIWPDPLPERLYLPDVFARHFTGGWNDSTWLPCRHWGTPPEKSGQVWPLLGMYDVPSQQKQHCLQMEPSRGGHLLLFGSAGTGKSTQLRSLVMSLALMQDPSQAQVYILDFGGQPSLKALEKLPHVGAVVTRLETERAERLIQYIITEVHRRNDLLRASKVDNWQDYNARVPKEKQLPALYLIIDSFHEFRQAFEPDFINSVTGLVGGGQAAGLFIAAATSLQGDLPNDLFANINLRVTFNQADTTEYYRLVGQPTDARIQEDAIKGMRPGRGLLRATPPLDFQAALPVAGESDFAQADNLIRTAEAMDAVWKGNRPQPIRMLPFHLTLPDELALKRGERQPLAVMLGQEYERLDPEGFSLVADGPAFLVAGTSAQTGKTTLLRTWLTGLLANYSPKELQIILVDFHARSLSGFRRFPHVSNYIGTRADLEKAFKQLQGEIQKRQELAEKAYKNDPDQYDQLKVISAWPHILTIIDDYERFHLQAAEMSSQLADCILQGGELGTSYIISGTLAELPKDYEDPFMQRFRKTGCGVLLGGTEGIEEFNNARRPLGQPAAGLPHGRGFIVRRGRAVLMQTAAPWEENEEPSVGLQKRIDALLKKKK